MLQDVKVISATRAYAYDPDAIRITMLATSQIAGSIAEAFDFRDIDLKAPVPLFSRPKRTDPPGVVFSNGSWDRGDGQIVPVRSLSISSEEIVVAVAAPSSYIDEVFEHLNQLMESFQSPDGTQIVENPVANQETSSVSFRAENFAKVFSMSVLRDAAATATGDLGHTSVPFSMDFWFRAGGSGFDEPAPAHKFTVAVRMRRSGEVDTFRSIAPLPSDRHVEYLEDVVRRL